MADAFQVQTSTAVAEFFGVSPSAITRWSQSGMPGEHGAFDLRAIAKWLAKQRGLIAGRMDIAEIKAQRELVKLTREKLELSAVEGKLVEADKIHAYYRTHLGAVRARLEAVPAECVASVPPDFRAEVIEELRNKLERVCLELAEREF